MENNEQNSTLVKIVKYKNRKLYNTDTAKYVSLGALTNMSLNSFVVVEKETGNDITDETLVAALSSFYAQNLPAFKKVKEQLLKNVQSHNDLLAV